MFFWYYIVMHNRHRCLRHVRHLLNQLVQISLAQIVTWSSVEWPTHRSNVRILAITIQPGAVHVRWGAEVGWLSIVVGPIRHQGDEVVHAQIVIGALGKKKMVGIPAWTRLSYIFQWRPGWKFRRQCKPGIGNGWVLRLSVNCVDSGGH